MARAILLAQRRALMKEPMMAAYGEAKPAASIDLEALIYPATRSPDDQLDRLGYGEQFDEIRSLPTRGEIKRQVLRTRSGNIRLGQTDETQAPADAQLARESSYGTPGDEP